MELTRSTLAVRMVPVASLSPHPRNYHSHPEDQLEHICSSIQAHGFYRNVVVARDLTILAGHGVVMAATRMGLVEVPVVQLDLDPDEPRALKVLTSDNEIGKLAEVDDRALTELLREIMHEAEDGLMGTGYSDEQLVALAMITRPVSELSDINAASEWVGLPEFAPISQALQLLISFETPEDREQFVEKHQLGIMKREARTWMTWWPERERRDLTSVNFQ